MKIEQAVIFCGGRGERLRPLTDTMPKPMVPVNGKPFLEYLFYTLEKAGIKKVLLLVGYKGSQIAMRYGSGYLFEFMIEYSFGSTEDMTGRRLTNAYDQLDDHFLLCYGDNYLSEIPLQEMQEHYGRYEAPLMTTVFNNKKGTGEYGNENNVWVGEDNYVTRYDKTRKNETLNGIDIGYFIVDKTFIDHLIPWNFSFEEKIIYESARTRKLIAYTTDQQYYWITNLESLLEFERVVTLRNLKTVEWRK